VIVSQGKATANFSQLDLGKHLDVVLDAVDQGYTVNHLNLTDTKLTVKHVYNDLLPWFKNNISVNVIDISNNQMSASIPEEKILLEFGITVNNDSTVFISGSPADLGKSIIAVNTGFSESTIQLLLNHCEHANKSIEERDKSKAESVKKTES